MPITKRLITNAAVLLALVAATLLGAGYLTAPPHVAQGHDGGSYDGTEHARGEHHTHSNRAWSNGSRCIGPGHIANRHTQDDSTLVHGHHTGFASGEYTTGAGRGTSTAKNLHLAKEHIEDTWEVQLTWRPAGWKADSNTWACQPHAFQAQRKIDNGPWERWNTSHPTSSRYSEITTQRKREIYGHQADYSLYKHETTGTPVTAHFRVCNKDQDGNIGACTGPVSTSVGGNPWHPEIEASVTNKPVWEDTSALQVAVTTDPPPPDGATDITLKVSFNVDKADDDFEVVTSHDVSISPTGTGSLSVNNPFTRTGADFTEDRSEPMRVKLAGGANSQDTHQFTLNILDDDPIPITVNFPDDDPGTFAVDGPGTKPATLNPSGSSNFAKKFQIGFTSPESVPTGNMGDTRCPKLAGTWNLDFTSSNTQAVGNQTMEFGCNRSKDVTVQSAGAFSITPGTRLTHANQGWTRPVALTGDASFSGAIHASNSVFPSKLGVGFSASRSAVDEGSQLTVTVNGYDYQGRHDPASCDPSGDKYGVAVELVDANSAVVDQQRTVQVSRHCQADAAFDIPHGVAGPLTASFSDMSMDRDVEQRGGYAVQFVTIRPDSTNIEVSNDTPSVTEGSSTTVTLRLTAAPTADVTIDPWCHNLPGWFNVTCTGDATPLTFTTSNWAQPQAITITASHDTRYDDRTESYTWTAESADPHYDGEKATVAITRIDDDSGPPLRFASPLSTTLSRNDRVTLRVKLPSYDESTDACRVSYVSFWTIREDLVSDDANEHPHRDTISTYFSIPEAGEYTSGVYEYVGEYSDGTQFMRVRHYQDGRDSDLELYDDTPAQTKDGRILGYAISTTTKCQGGLEQWPGVPKPVDQPSCAAVGNGNSWKLCKWVNYSVD